MAVNIHNLIAAINPDVYCKAEKRELVKSIVKKMLNSKEKKDAERAYLIAAKEAIPREADAMDFVDIMTKTLVNKPGFDNPIEKHKLIYDSFGESLEPIYFWIIDTVGNIGLTKVDKFIDNFASSPGSGHFTEMGTKAARMQEEAMKMLGAANQVLKSILNILYDLKEFEIRLGLYKKLNSGTKEEKESAIQSLKQIWLDNVDIKRGNTSIKALALGGQSFFVTLIDAFMAAENEKLEFKGGEMDLNERVKRIVQQRIGEFYSWLKMSEEELKKRFEIERNYLKSQINTVKLYARWAKPYLKAAKQLEQNAAPTAGLVSSFSTSIFELCVFARAKYDPDEEVKAGGLPDIILKDRTKRTYHFGALVEFKFRSAPEKTNQGYGFRGRAELEFTSYALNDDELKVLQNQLDLDDVDDVMSLIEGSTTESLGQLKEDIAHFIPDGDQKKEESDQEVKAEKKSEDTNPFSALFSGLFSSSSGSGNKGSGKKVNGIVPDSMVEEIVRAAAILDGRRRTAKLYEIYKKGHKMPAYAPLDDAF